MKPNPLVPPERLKEALLRECPERCRDWTEAEWDASAGRMSALARLLWEAAQQEPGDGRKG